MERGLSKMFEIRESEPSSPLHVEVAEVRYDALYREWGLPRSLIEDIEARTFRHAAAFDGGTVIGYARIRLEGGDSRISQVSVAPGHQGEGIGAALVEALVRMARIAGRTEVTLDARTHVIAFYERLGFVAEGKEFLSERTGTPHRRMRKAGL
ncbi:MAG: GNAT family N-acetyltransferase [Coriobacteriia bacterium]|jgi:predicted GNAT family N-acyltransferase|nr:GNAT family N-acetyltransferase [Coriobacteriia bacterium]